MTRKVLAVLALVLAIPAVEAREVSSHDIRWYEEHPAARASLLSRCRGDFAWAKQSDCQNAEQADIGSSRSHPTNITELLNDPVYWAQNGLARRGALQSCARGDGFWTASNCAAAAAGDRMGSR